MHLTHNQEISMMRRVKGYTSTYSSYWGQRRKPWWQKIGLWWLLSIPVLLVLSEFLLRGGVWLFNGEPWLAEATPPISLTSAYGLGDRGLRVNVHQALGYTLIPNQSSPFWQINAQGFRSSANVKETPDPKETRIFLLGNSTAFGYGAGSNQQILGKLIEALLNQKVDRQRQELARRAAEFNEFNPPPPTLFTIKDTRFRVITAAVPGYASGNNLSLLAFQIMAFRPEGLIILGGYEDLRLPSTQTIATLKDYNPVLNLAPWWQDLYLVRLSHKLTEQTTPPPAPYQTFHEDQFSGAMAEAQGRINRLLHHWQQISHITASANIPTLIALQPELAGKSQNLSPAETALLQQLGKNYSDRLQTNYTLLHNANKNLKMLNLRRLFQNFNDTAFTDPIHLTAPANRLLAETIANQTASLYPPEIRKSE